MLLHNSVTLHVTEDNMAGKRRQLGLLDKVFTVFRLMHLVRRRYVEFKARNVVRCGKVDLPKSLFDKPLLGCRDFGGFRLSKSPLQYKGTLRIYDGDGEDDAQ